MGGHADRRAVHYGAVVHYDNVGVRQVFQAVPLYLSLIHIYEYPPLRIKPNPDCHDRLIVLDYGEETERVYHCEHPVRMQGKSFVPLIRLQRQQSFIR